MKTTRTTPLLMRLFICVILSCLTINHATAAPAEAPITYAKERLILKSRTPDAAMPQPNALFYVDVRSAGSSVNADWFQLAGFKPGTGLLLTYSTPQVAEIEPANIYAAYDIIALNIYGEIALILPDMVLANLTESIATPEPVAALLYVGAGTASALGLTIGDMAEHRMFTSRPRVIDALNADANPTPAPLTTAPEVLPAGNEIPIETDGRRRPVGNPVIAKPTAPTPPKAPTPPSISAPATNTNLNQNPAQITPDAPPTAPDFLNMILKREPEQR